MRTVVARRVSPALGLALLLSASVSTEQQAPPARGAESGTILGRVVTLHAGTPVADAVAALHDSAGQEVDAVRTTAEGWFLFTSVPPGDWTIGAVKAGYQSTGLSQRRASVTLAPGEHVRDVDVPLIQYGAIEGTVIDDAGQPVVGVTVQSHRLSGSGFGAWTRSYTATTDDRGRYRLFVAPSDYTVSVPTRVTWMPVSTFDAIRRGEETIRAAFDRDPATAALIGSLQPDGAAISDGRYLQLADGPTVWPRDANGQCRLFTTRFNGGATTAATAPVVAVTDGAEVTAVDIRLDRASGVWVAGVVSSPERTVASVPLSLTVDDSLHETVVARTYSAPDGTFAFQCVAPGEYRVRVEQKIPSGPARGRGVTTVQAGAQSARLSGPPTRRAADDALVYASVPLLVGNADVEDVAIELQRGRRLSGRVVIEGEASETPRLRRSVQLWAAGGREAYFSAPVAEDLTFTTPELPADSYYITAFSSDGLAARSIVVNGEDVADGLLTMPPSDVTDVVVTMTMLAEVRGRVDGEPGLSRPRVMLFPVDRSLWPDRLTPNRRRTFATNADSAGAFAIDKVPAGDYFLVAVDVEPTGDWRVGPSLERLARVAERITVEAGIGVTRSLKATTLPPMPATGGPAMPTAPPITSVADRPRVAPAASAITGHIVSAGRTATRLAGAHVRVTSTDGAVTRSTLTARDGRFEVDGLPPGRYLVDAAKPAYLRMAHDAPAADRPGMPVELGGNDHVEVEIALPRGAAITGRVTNAFGHPFMGARVAVLTLHSTPDGPVLTPVVAAQPADPLVNDKGDYRIYGLPPGDYYVGAAVDQGAAWPARSLDNGAVRRARQGLEIGTSRDESADQFRMYGPSFHPSGSDLTMARVIRVEAGDVAEGIDIRIDPEPAGSLAGRLQYPDGSPAAGLNLVMLPVGLRVPGASQLGASSQSAVSSFGGAARLTTADDGTFSATGLPAARYTVAALDNGGASRGAFWAIEDITVGGQDLRNVAITMRPALTLTGRITTPEPVTRAPSPTLALDGVVAGALAAEQTVAEMAGDGTFTFNNVLPGRYVLQVSGLPTPWIADDAAIGGVGFLDTPVDIATDGTIDLRLTNAPASVSGRFDDAAGRPASAYYVVLFSADRSHWRAGARRIVAVRPSVDGRFVVPNLPAGAYLMAALADLREGEWHDPTRLEQLAAGAIPLTLAAGEARVQDIRIGSR